MSLPVPVHEDHRVLGEDYCNGYVDTFGRWNNGFPCPRLPSEPPVYCCGSEQYRYCCNKEDEQIIATHFPQLALILGVVFGVVVAFIVIVLVSCFHCTCCLLYKKGQPTNTGTIYQMQCSSSASGVANMYSFSGTTTPSETPRSVSRSSSRSQGTVDSGWSVGQRLERHLRQIEEAACPGQVSFETTYTQPSITGEHSDVCSSVSEAGTEPPPAYCSQHSSLMTVRPPIFNPPAPPRPPSPPHSTISPFVISNMHTYSSGGLGTFPQSFMSSCSPARPTCLRSPPTLASFTPTLTPALTPTTRPSSTAQIITTHHQASEDHLYTATKF